MTIEYIRSINDTIHTAIYNYDNKFCYWVSVIQHLHTSKTLNQLCSQLTEQQLNSSLWYQLLKPLNIYSKLVIDTDDEYTKSNVLSIYTMWDNYFNEFIPQHVHERARNGYQPHYLLLFCYCPTIYHLFKDNFIKILNEMHVDRTLFNVAPSIAENNITTKHPFILDPNFQQELVSEWNQMMKFMESVKTITLEPFCSATLEIFPNPDHTGGHAITLIRGYANTEPDKEDYYVIDDHNTISLFCDYFNHHNQKLYEISIRDVDDLMIEAFNKYIHNTCNIDKRCKFSARITRYSLTMDHNFLEPTDTILKLALRESANTNDNTNDINTNIPNNTSYASYSVKDLERIDELSIPKPSIFSLKFIQSVWKQLLSVLVIGIIIGALINHTFTQHKEFLKNSLTSISSSLSVFRN